MQTRKLTVNTVDYFMLAGSMRAYTVIHTPVATIISQLLLIGTPVSFFHDGAEVSAAEVEPGVDAAFRPDARAARRHTTFCHNPQPAGAIVNLVSSISEDAVAIRDSADDADFLVSVTGGVGVNFGNRCLTGTGR